MRTLNTLLSVMGLSALIALPLADAADYTYLEMSGKLTLTQVYPNNPEYYQVDIFTSTADGNTCEYSGKGYLASNILSLASDDESGSEVYIEVIAPQILRVINMPSENCGLNCMATGFYALFPAQDGQ